MKHPDRGKYLKAITIELGIWTLAELNGIEVYGLIQRP